MKQKIAIVCVIILIMSLVATNILANAGITNDEYYQMGYMQRENTNTQKQNVAIIEGDYLSVSNKEIESYVVSGLSETKEDAIEEIVKKELFIEEATKLGIVVTNDEVDALVECQKEFYSQPEEQIKLTNFAQGEGITEDQYWIVHYEDFREYLLLNELEEKLYEDFLFERAKTEANRKNIEMSDDRIRESIANKKFIYDEETLNSFNNYCEDFTNRLISEKNVELLE